MDVHIDAVFTFSRRVYGCGVCMYYSGDVMRCGASVRATEDRLNRLSQGGRLRRGGYDEAEQAANEQYSTVNLMRLRRAPHLCCYGTSKKNFTSA